ncbi:unnamed protein product [Amoebophrya sp. A120]|nr:unnamed protein product [Amoebophrya sp. A120]|eukprot:GSA120T00005849001.1
MSATLAWDSFLGVGQQPPAMMTNARIVAFDRQNFVLVGGLTGRRSKRVFNLRNYGEQGWQWRDITPKLGDAFEEVCNQAMCALRYEDKLPRNKVNLTRGRCMLFVFGGQVQGGVNDAGRPVLSSATYFLDLENPIGPIWRKLFCPEAPTAREGACALVHRGEIFLFGGRAAAMSNSNGIMADMWSLDIDQCDMNAQVQSAEAYGGGLGGSTWVPHATVKSGRYPKGRYGHAMVSIADKIYLFGGMSDQKLGDLWCYTPATTSFSSSGILKRSTATSSSSGNSWNPVRTVGKTPAARSGHGMLYVEPDSLVVWGGMLKDAPGGFPVMGTTVYVLDLQCLYWTTPYVLGECPPPRKSMAVSDFTGGIFVCYGGAPCGDVFRNCIETPQRAFVYTLRSTLDDAVSSSVTNNNAENSAGGAAKGGDAEAGASTSQAPPATGDVGNISAKASEHFLTEGRDRLLSLKLQLERRKKEVIELVSQLHKEQAQREQKDRILRNLSKDIFSVDNEMSYLQKRNKILYRIGLAEQSLRKSCESSCQKLKGLASVVEAIMIAKEGGDDYIKDLLSSATAGGGASAGGIKKGAPGGQQAESEDDELMRRIFCSHLHSSNLEEGGDHQQQVEPNADGSFTVALTANASGSKSAAGGNGKDAAPGMKSGNNKGGSNPSSRRNSSATANSNFEDEDAAAEAAEAELEELEKEHKDLLKQVLAQEKKHSTEERKLGDLLQQLRVDLGVLDDTQALHEQRGQQQQLGAGSSSPNKHNRSGSRMSPDRVEDALSPRLSDRGENYPSGNVSVPPLKFYNDGEVEQDEDEQAGDAGDRQQEITSPLVELDPGGAEFREGGTTSNNLSREQLSVEFHQTSQVLLDEQG